MSDLAQIITGEFEEALEVKNPKSLQRGIFLLLSSTVQKDEHTTEHYGLKDSINTLSRNVELIALRMEEGFKRMDTRFEVMDKRFEAVDKRFEDVNKRFEAIDKRFESVDERFESMQQQMNRRFDAVDKRFNRLTSFMSVGFVVITTLITVYRFLG